MRECREHRKDARPCAQQSEEPQRSREGRHPTVRIRAEEFFRHHVADDEKHRREDGKFCDDCSPRRKPHRFEASCDAESADPTATRLTEERRTQHSLRRAKLAFKHHCPRITSGSSHEQPNAAKRVNACFKARCNSREHHSTERDAGVHEHIRRMTHSSPSCETSTVSTRAPSIDSTSSSTLPNWMRSPTRGTRVNRSSTSPATVLVRPDRI